MSLTLARGEVPVMVALRLFLPDNWVNNRRRLKRAGVPAEYRTSRTKPEIALAEIDRLISIGVRFRCVLADAGYGLSAPFRQGLTARKLAWAVASLVTSRCTLLGSSSFGQLPKFEAGHVNGTCRIVYRQQLKTCWPVRRDTVAKDIITLNNDIASVDPDPKPDWIAFCASSVVVPKLFLNLHGTGDSVHSAREFHQRAVAHKLDDTTRMGGNHRVDQLTPLRYSDAREVLRLIDTHEARVAHHIG